MACARMGRWALAVIVSLGGPPLTACSVASLDYLTDGKPDGSAPTQGDGDGVAPSDAQATKPWCLQQTPAPFLCMDFDEEGGLAEGYLDGSVATLPGPAVSSSAGSALVGQGASAHSPPGGFAATLQALASGANESVEYDVPATLSSVSTVQLRFDMRLIAFTSTGEVDFATLYMGGSAAGGAAYRAYLLFIDGQGAIETDVTSAVPFALPSDGNWHTYRLDLSLTPSVTLDLYVDDPDAAGVPVARLTESMAYPPSSQAGFLLGIHGYGPTAATQAAIDNVLYDGQ